MTEMH